MNPQQNKVPAPEFILVHVFRNSFQYRKVPVNWIFFCHAEPSQSPPQPPAVHANLREDTCAELTGEGGSRDAWFSAMLFVLISLEGVACLQSMQN